MYLALVVCFGWIFALCVHEFCHAMVAYVGGDKSVKEKGYLSLNPLKYTDPGLTLVVPIVMLMIGGIALPGAAVYINRSALRNRAWHSAVAAAGPFGSAVMIFVYALPFMLKIPLPEIWMYAALALMVLLQVVAFILNSLPIPPLDGYGVIEPWLPQPMRAAMDNFGRYGIWLVFGLMWFVPPLNSALWNLALDICVKLGVPENLPKIGYALFSQQKFYLVLVLIVIMMLGRVKKKDSAAQPAPQSSSEPGPIRASAPQTNSPGE
jgi:Zn-dependent protease